MQQVLQELGIPLAHPCWVQRKKRWHIHSIQTHPCVGLRFWIYRTGPLTFVHEIYFLVTLRHAEPARISGTLRRGSRLFTWRHHGIWMKCERSRALRLQSELHSPHSLCRVAAEYPSWCPKFQTKANRMRFRVVWHSMLFYRRTHKFVTTATEITLMYHIHILFVKSPFYYYFSVSNVDS